MKSSLNFYFVFFKIPNENIYLGIGFNLVTHVIIVLHSVK